MEIVSIVKSTWSLYKLLFEDDGDDKELVDDDASFTLVSKMQRIV